MAIRTLNEDNSPVWKAFKAKSHDELTELAKKPDADFSVLTKKTQKTIFHKCISESTSCERLKAISKGYKEGNKANTSIAKTINRPWNGQTPFVYACKQKKDNKILRCLASMGANTSCLHPNLVKKLLSPVWEAYENWDYETLTALAKDPKIDFSILNEEEQTIFHRCVIDNADDRLGAIESGFKGGGRSNSTITKAINMFWKKMTPLYTAAESGKLSTKVKGSKGGIIQLLLSLGADEKIPFIGPSGKMLPADVIEQKWKNYLEPNLQMYLSHGKVDQALTLLQSKPSLFETICDDQRNNGMLLALSNWNETKGSEDQVIEVLKELQKRGESVNHANSQGETPLAVAIEKRSRSVIKYLSAQTSSKNPSENIPVQWTHPLLGTVVHLAAGFRREDVDILHILISTYPDLAVYKNNFGRTPLFFVTCIEAATLLINAGALVTALDNNGSSPISHLLPKDEFLGDWLSLYDPALSKEQKAAIVEKNSFKNRLEDILTQPPLISSGMKFVWEGIKTAAEAHGGPVLRKIVEKVIDWLFPSSKNENKSE